jgi:hypothetical protein
MTAYSPIDLRLGPAPVLWRDMLGEALAPPLRRRGILCAVFASLRDATERARRAAVGSVLFNAPTTA